MVVVEVHVAGDPLCQFRQGGKGVPVVELVLQDGPERFCGRMIEARAGAPHGPPDAETLTDLGDRSSTKLGTSVGVENDS